MSEMKAWQHGYELDYLKGLEEKYYSRYNKFWTLSPFTNVKKNAVADMLHKGELKLKDRFAFSIREVKAKSAVKTHDHVYGYRLPGEVVISKIGLSEDFNSPVIKDANMDATNLIGSLQLPVDKNIWVEVFAEDTFMRSIVKAAGFQYIGSKVMSTAEIIAIYFLDRSPGNLRYFFKLPETEQVNIRLIDFDLDKPKTIITPAGEYFSNGPWISLLNNLAESIVKLNVDFQVHYSNYNYKKTWSALSLRGFSPDVTFIEKPSEMNEKWWEKHKDETFEIQDTELMKQFWQVQKIMDMIPGRKERVRLMKLAANNGELLRHTDLVDEDSGTADGKVMRLHFPIITNPDVTFYSWKLNGELDTVHMEIGSCWYLDTRKPHAAVNKGDTDRIHLVIDVWANDELRKMMMHEGWTVTEIVQDSHELPFDPYTNPTGKDPYDAD